MTSMGRAFAGVVVALLFAFTGAAGAETTIRLEPSPRDAAA